MARKATAATSKAGATGKLKYEDEIPPGWRRTKRRRLCITVGDLIDELAQLPKGLPLADRIQVVVTRKISGVEQFQATFRQEHELD